MARTWEVTWTITGTVVVEEDEGAETPEQATILVKKMNVLDLVELVVGDSEAITVIKVEG